MREWTTLSIRRKLLEKLREIYRAYGGNERFGNFATFLDLMVDVFLLVDPEVVLQVLHQKQFGQSREFRESLEKLRRKHASYTTIQQIRPSVPFSSPTVSPSIDSIDKDDEIEIEIPDEHIL